MDMKLVLDLEPLMDSKQLGTVAANIEDGDQKPEALPNENWMAIVPPSLFTGPKPSRILAFP
ncbi:hypothetical protein E2542_SST17463 [Spatholobus suberectus]|nr:hypothetical protein E2542_SST17463 [Spatholobus suberectus]